MSDKPKPTKEESLPLLINVLRYRVGGWDTMKQIEDLFDFSDDYDELFTLIGNCCYNIDSIEDEENLREGARMLYESLTEEKGGDTHG